MIGKGQGKTEISLDPYLSCFILSCFILGVHRKV